jgi:heptosyltransferase-1
MGDIVHALPAAAALRRSFPDATLDWAIHPRWSDLLVRNPLAARPIGVNRRDGASLRAAWRALRAAPYDIAVDLQGLVQSALVARCARARCRYGYDPSQAREWPAGLMYSHPVRTRAPHVVERCLAIAQAAGAGAGPIEFPLPPGRAEGDLPARYVLASPLAGWTAKQWPLDNYSTLARLLHSELGLALVLNGSVPAEALLRAVPGVQVHISSVAGLIDATRRATAVVGLDSGPMHLAAALAKPGVALFGPTDPARNGPYGTSLIVLRDAAARTTYRRGASIDPSMLRLAPGVVVAALRASIAASHHEKLTL